MAKNKCVVEGCNEEATCSDKSLCNACYQGMYYWKDRSPTDIVRRKRQINRLSHRMDYMQPNVRVTNRRRRTG